MPKMTISVKREQINHEKRSHALLSASGANRWINCPPSARLEEKEGPRTTTAYAQEGTLAHELSELYIRHDILKSIDDQFFSDSIDSIMNNSLFSEEMFDYAEQYANYCAEQFAAAQQVDNFSELRVEEKLDFTKYIPEGFGTSDCTIISDKNLEVIDFKYGKGIPVYAEWNKQLMLYGLGALLKYDLEFDISSIKLTIVQPRLNNISSWSISVDDLITWANTVLIPAAKLAYEGKGDLNPGEWCKFCMVRNRCRALYDQQIEITKHDFKNPELLSDEELADILARMPKFTEWLNSIHEYALNLAVKNGKVWPGFKLVEGISRRKWLDEDKVAETIFEKIPEATEDDIYEMKLKSISQIEKQFGKKVVSEMLSSVIVKPQGKPTLVPESDKRPSLGIEDAISDFSNNY